MILKHSRLFSEMNQAKENLCSILDSELRKQQRKGPEFSSREVDLMRLLPAAFLADCVCIVNPVGFELTIGGQ